MAQPYERTELSIARFQHTHTVNRIERLQRHLHTEINRKAELSSKIKMLSEANDGKTYTPVERHFPVSGEGN